ncbi:MAG: calcium-binding protein [Acidimicrobiia bacterium]|nr:calcium-binding protein [Acidimicrobiia bacterium]
MMVASGKMVLLGGTIAISAAFALLLGDTPAGAQDDRPMGTIQLDVRYPDGSLVDDTPVCIQGYGAPATLEGGSFFLGSIDSPVSPTARFPVDANSGMAFEILQCQGDGNLGFGSTWHFGQPRTASPFGYRPNPGEHAVMVKEGQTHVLSVVVGRATISGSVVGDEFQRCTLAAFGTTTWGGGVATYVGSLDVADNERDFTLTVGPGEYELRLECLGPRLNVVWPATGERFTVAHGDTIENVDFDVSGRGSDDGSFVVVNPQDADIDVPYCLDVMTPSGVQLREGSPGTGSESVWIEKDQAVKLRARDCRGFGFSDTWYPNSPTSAGAEIVTPDGTEFDLFLPTRVDLAPDDLFLCNGMQATAIGSGAANSFVGTPRRDVIISFAGPDTIHGFGGADVICSGSGNDRVFGNAGADWIDAGSGDDWVGAGWGNDSVFGGPGNDFIRGFRHDDVIDGGDGNDKITGGWGNDVLRGGRGNDTLRAYFGADELYGDQGNDALVAGNGPDLLVGGWGERDRLFGDQGRDTCIDGGVATEFSECSTINGEPVR